MKQESIGSGSYGHCYHARYRGIDVVVKKMIYSNTAEDKLRAKRDLMHEAEVITALGDHCFTSSVFASVRPREELVCLELQFVLFKTIHFLFYCVCKSISRRIQASSPREFAWQRWNRRVFPLVLLASKQRKGSCSVSLRCSARNSSIEILVELPFHEVWLLQSGCIFHQFPWLTLQFTCGWERKIGPNAKPGKSVRFRA